MQGAERWKPCDKVRYLATVPRLARKGPRQTNDGLLHGARRYWGYRTPGTVAIARDRADFINAVDALRDPATGNIVCRSSRVRNTIVMVAFYRLASEACASCGDSITASRSWSIPGS